MSCEKHGHMGIGICVQCVNDEMVRRSTATLPTVLPGYEPLARVLQAALDQSQSGKGKDRHATTGKPFTSQPICEIGRMTGIGYNVGQAMKKGQEAMRLPAERAQAELLGAIVYLASAHLLIGESDGNGR
jgi:hypothetical protein